MRAVIQRVSDASVKIDGKIKGKIGPGMVILLGIEAGDTVDSIQKLTYKITRLRIFNDAEGKMNLSLTDIMGQVMVISQFTLFASTKKGSRPSFIRAAKPEFARMLYEMFVLQLEKELSTRVVTGEFGADMKVSLTNDGPVTLLIDTEFWE
ncbi:MAG: D-aminoacyl-tRNA deacylase [Flavobacteriales bacterium]|nr:D-aminoacyl-tRNA deacylase [Flavobacteriales bacterium]